MTLRKVYVYPDEMIEVRVIRDDAEPKTANAWLVQIKPPCTLIKVFKEGEIGVINRMLNTVELG